MKEFTNYYGIRIAKYVDRYKKEHCFSVNGKS